METLYDEEGRCCIDMDEVFMKLRSKYPNQVEDIKTFVMPGFHQVLLSKHPKAGDLILKIHEIFEGKEGGEALNL